MKADILLLPGDGIGPEIVSSARRVLKRVAERFGHEFVFSEALIGGAAIDAAAKSSMFHVPLHPQMEKRKLCSMVFP